MSGRPVPVSVVIPCYRCSGTIGRAVSSVQRQTSRPAEVVLVDDGSGDETLRVLKDMRGRLGADWVKVVALAVNAGPSAARNAGWAIATQPYVAFLDADDAWLENKLEVQHAWMRNHPEFSLTAHAYSVNEDGCSALELSGPNAEFRPVTSMALLARNRFSTPTVMMRSSLPIRFDESRRFSEDYLLWAMVSLSGYGCAWSPDPLTVLYKPAVSRWGLSSEVLRMSAGELGNYRLLWRRGLLRPTAALLAGSWSIVRASRRVLLHFARRTFGGNGYV